MKITIISKKEKIDKFYLESYKEYIKRLSNFCKIDIIYYKKDIDIANLIPKSSYIILLSKKSNLISSIELSEKISNLALIGNSNITFIISDNINSFDETINVSRMDIGSALLASMLLEQIYRAFTIIHGKTYHK